MITHEQESGLVEAGKHLSTSQWFIGYTTLDIIDAHSERRELVYRNVGQLCGLSARRVEKLSYVCVAFAGEDRDKYPFGYYERAYELGEQKYDAIEYLDFFVQEYGRVPTISEFVFMFREHILGEVTVDPLPTPSMPPDDLVRYLGNIRYIISSRYGGNERIMALLEELEALVCQMETDFSFAE